MKSTNRTYGEKKVANMRRTGILTACLLVLHSATGCAGVASRAGARLGCVVQLQTTRHELFFGLVRKDGRVILESDFESFLDTVITPLFPEGLTVFDAAGQYRTTEGVLIDESTKVLVLIYPDTNEVRGRIAEIIDRYRTRFQQESVGWVRTPVCASF